MNVQRLATRTLAAGGSLLLVVAAIHLAVTPELRDLFLRSSGGSRSMRFWLAPFLLNHVVVAILLVPVGITTILAARAARAGAPWARAVALTNALSVLALPVALVTLMDRGYFGAKPFLVAAILVTVAGVALVAAALALWSRSNDGAKP